MSDAPEGRGREPERGSRGPPRVGDSGSPVGSTLSIVLAVVAVVAGFLILRAIFDDDDGGATGVVTPATRRRRGRRHDDRDAEPARRPRRTGRADHDAPGDATGTSSSPTPAGSAARPGR